MAATIVADSGTGLDCVGTTTDGGYSIDDDGSCGLSAANHSISDSTTLNLGPLANNGGPTETVLPADTSSAVGVIPPDTTLNDVEVCPRVDQRGVASSGDCTVGAVEVTAYTSAYTAVTPYRICDTRGTDGLVGTNAQCAGQHAVGRRHPHQCR